MANLGNMAGTDINTAEEQELYESLFADTGSRENISISSWKAGWPAIVGGINGIPTSRQFNTLQYITDLKCLMLYQEVVALQQAGATGIKIGPVQELANNMILFETLKNSNKIVRVRRKDKDGKEYEYDLAAVFELAEKREGIQSGETLSTLFGKIMRFLADLKPNCFSDADDSFVQMTELNYKPPSERTKGSLYGLITDKRGLIIEYFDRYVSGSEEPRIERTLYGIETKERTSAEEDPSPYVGILNNIVHVEERQEVERKPFMIYSVNKQTR